MDFENHLFPVNDHVISPKLNTDGFWFGKSPSRVPIDEPYNHRTNIFSSTADEDSDDYGDYDAKDQMTYIGIESSQALEKLVPKSHQGAIEKKLSWLRSQIIGADAQIDTPFGKRRLTYADHTASGRCLNNIENSIRTSVLPYYGNSHTSDSHVGYHTTKMVHEAASYVKKCLGGGENDALIFCGSGATAAIKRLQEVMGIAIPSILREKILRYLSDEERWVVFVGPYEHHSNILSWRQSLAEVVEIGLDANGRIDMDELKKKLKFYKTKKWRIIGSFSACSNVTGLYTDTRAIARLLHWFGGFVCFDFAASGPYEKIDMKSGELDGYDAIFLSPHKFLGGPGTPGVLLMNKALYALGSSPPSTCGGGTVDFVNGFNEKDTLYVHDIEEREDAGTPQIIQKIRAALVFSIKEYIGYKAIETYESKYITMALQVLLPNSQILILGNTTAKRQAILSFVIYTTTYSALSSPHGANVEETMSSSLDMWRETGNIRDKPLHGPFVAKLLNDLFGIQARGGCACAGPYGHNLLNVDETRSLAFRSTIEKGYTGIKPGWTRVSFPYYMSKEEFDFILAAIEFITIYGQRFLPLYHFDWKSGTWSFKRNSTLRGDVKYFNNTRASYLSSMIETLTDERDDNQTGILHEYASNLAAAKQIASLLPKFPPQRKIPEELDVNLVPFRV